ncbi:phage adaptor protein [Novosphingobium clariflavum]|uniref:Phage protein n=1 Tax=Novosphingobium clariflavum TaxID=2029884 RepID=A0ABV6SB47_9SPHN|nr:hypothetical protein [Novosphingobium clariflavum]
MNFSQLKARLRGLINRSDMTDDLAAQFIRDAQVRLERELRLSFMQKYVTFSIAEAQKGGFRVPPDYLEMIELFTDHGQLERVDTSYWLKRPKTLGVPECFIQTGHDIRMRPYPKPDETIYLRYYGMDAQLQNDAQTNVWATACADALIYGAAEYAADHYEDERLQRFAQRYGVCIQELSDQQQQEDFSGPMRIQPAYRYPQD